MIISRAKTAKSLNDLHSQPADTKDKNASKWRYENTSEASVLGNQFAQVIMMVASGSSDQILKKKKVHSPSKKIFWEDPRFNPAIENTNDSYAHNAHRLEETNYWKRKGKRFPTGPRFVPDAPTHGPLIPAEIKHLFEKPTVVFERSGQLRPFSRARKYNVPHEHCTPNLERAYQEARTAQIGPSTYRLPDFWDTSSTTTMNSVEPKLSSMRSATPRFPGDKSVRSDFPVEKSGTSIPHSRGRSRGAGFRETSRPVSESVRAAQVAANSISSWESFQEAPSPEFNRFGSCSISADSLANSAICADKFYEVSADPKQLNSINPDQQRLRTLSRNKHSSSQQRMHNMSAGSLVKSDVRNSSNSPQRTASTAPASVSDYAPSRSNSFIMENNLSAPSSSQQRRVSRGNIPGFTMPTKGTQPLFAVPDYNKSYKRMILPDGTVGILPVTTESASAEPSLKTVTFSVEPRLSISGPPQLAVGNMGSADPVLQLLNNGGPQIRSMTPPRPSPPSLTRSNLYSSLLANSPPRKALPGGAVLDDESTHSSQVISVKTTTNTASSYGRAVVQKWVPPVSYSGRQKGPVPDIGAIPYKPKRSTPYGVRRSADQYALLEGNSAFAQSLVDDMLPLDHQQNSRGFSPGGDASNSNFGRPLSADLRRASKLGGINAGERRRQDSLGAQALSRTDIDLRKSVSNGSAKLLQTVENR